MTRGTPPTARRPVHSADHSSAIVNPSLPGATAGAGDRSGCVALFNLRKLATMFSQPISSSVSRYLTWVPAAKVRILIADDHPAVRQSLAELLAEIAAP